MQRARKEEAGEDEEPHAVWNREERGRNADDSRSRWGNELMRIMIGNDHTQPLNLQRRRLIAESGACVGGCCCGARHTCKQHTSADDAASEEGLQNAAAAAPSLMMRARGCRRFSTAAVGNRKSVLLREEGCDLVSSLYTGHSHLF